MAKNQAEIPKSPGSFQEFVEESSVIGRRALRSVYQESLEQYREQLASVREISREELHMGPLPIDANTDTVENEI